MCRSNIKKRLLPILILTPLFIVLFLLDHSEGRQTGDFPYFQSLPINQSNPVMMETSQQSSHPEYYAPRRINYEDDEDDELSESVDRESDIHSLRNPDHRSEHHTLPAQPKPVDRTYTSHRSWNTGAAVRENENESPLRPLNMSRSSGSFNKDRKEPLQLRQVIPDDPEPYNDRAVEIKSQLGQRQQRNLDVNSYSRYHENPDPMATSNRSNSYSRDQYSQHRQVEPASRNYDGYGIWDQDGRRIQSQQRQQKGSINSRIRSQIAGNSHSGDSGQGELHHRFVEPLHENHYTNGAIDHDLRGDQGQERASSSPSEGYSTYKNPREGRLPSSRSQGRLQLRHDEPSYSSHHYSNEPVERKKEQTKPSHDSIQRIRQLEPAHVLHKKAAADHDDADINFTARNLSIQLNIGSAADVNKVAKYGVDNPEHSQQGYQQDSSHRFRERNYNFGLYREWRGTNSPIKVSSLYATKATTQKRRTSRSTSQQQRHSYSAHREQLDRLQDEEGPTNPYELDRQLDQMQQQDEQRFMNGSYMRHESASAGRSITQNQDRYNSERRQVDPVYADYSGSGADEEERWAEQYLQRKHEARHSDYQQENSHELDPVSAGYKTDTADRYHVNYTNEIQSYQRNISSWKGGPDLDHATDRQERFGHRVPEDDRPSFRERNFNFGFYPAENRSTSTKTLSLHITKKPNRKRRFRPTTVLPAKDSLAPTTQVFVEEFSKPTVKRTSGLVLAEQPNVASSTFLVDAFKMTSSADLSINKPLKLMKPKTKAKSLFTGDATFTYDALGLGGCDKYHETDEMIVAVSQELYRNLPNPNDSPFCGKCAVVTYRENAVKVTIVDRCIRCASGDVEMSVPAFEQLADLEVGRIKVEWFITPCRLDMEDPEQVLPETTFVPAPGSVRTLLERLKNAPRLEVSPFTLLPILGKLYDSTGRSTEHPYRLVTSDFSLNKPLTPQPPEPVDELTHSGWSTTESLGQQTTDLLFEMPRDTATNSPAEAIFVNFALTPHTQTQWFTTEPLIKQSTDPFSERPREANIDLPLDELFTKFADDPLISATSQLSVALLSGTSKASTAEWSTAGFFDSLANLVETVANRSSEEDQSTEQPRSLLTERFNGNFTESTVKQLDGVPRLMEQTNRIDDDYGANKVKGHEEYLEPPSVQRQRWMEGGDDANTEDDELEYSY